MRIRVVLAGIGSGAVCLSALWFPWYVSGLVAATPEWLYAAEAAVMPGWMDTAIPIFCGLGFSSKPVSASETPIRASDWVGYMLANGILGGTQIFASAPAYAIVLAMITVENIPHLFQTGIVETQPANQIISLSTTMTTIATTCIILAAIGSLLFGAIVLLVRQFLKIRPSEQAQVSSAD